MIILSQNYVKMKKNKWKELGTNSNLKQDDF